MLTILLDLSIPKIYIKLMTKIKIHKETIIIAIRLITMVNTDMKKIQTIKILFFKQSENLINTNNN
jgi:hypothetical protein